MSQLVSKRLQQKYSQAFHFYKVRPINQIINGNYQSKTYIELNDIRTYVDDTEYLRRMYFFRTLTGKSEIDYRIKLCGQYYSKQLAIAHHYPMMIITNTKSLFVKRNRRLKKIQAGEGSSDQTEKQDQDFIQFDQRSIDILDDLESSSLEGSNSKQSFGESYDSSQFDMFAESESQVDLHNHINLRVIEESSLSHLIADLSPKQPQKYDNESTAFASLDNKYCLSQSISVTAISNQKFSQQKEKKKGQHNLSKYFDLLQQSRGLILSDLFSSQQHTAKDHTYKQSHRKEVHGIKQDSENQKLQLQQRRRRIREKAEQLLRRAKNDQQDGHIVRQ